MVELPDPEHQCVGMQDEPKRAMLPAYLLCAAGVLIGAIDVIAPIVSMCFLTCYATINFSCFVMAVTQVRIWHISCWMFVSLRVLYHLRTHFIS